MKNIVLLLCFISSLLTHEVISQNCNSYPCYVSGTGATVNLRMWDNFGDGWNGNYWSIFGGCANAIYFGSSTPISYTLPSGSFGQVSFFVPAGNWGIQCTGGSWQSEVYWEVWIGGSFILSGGAPYYTSQTGFYISPQCATGCIDPSATNYDPNAYIQMSAGDCTYGPPPSSGCTDPIAFNYDPNATTDDGSCCYVSGCTDPTANNYNSNACYDDGTCVYCTAFGCTDPTACNYDPNAQCDDGTCLTTYGCTDPTACNYDSNSQCDDGSCVFPSSNIMTVTACDSYTWPVNGVTYDSSAIYTYISNGGGSSNGGGNNYSMSFDGSPDEVMITDNFNSTNQQGVSFQFWANSAWNQTPTGAQSEEVMINFGVVSGNGHDFRYIFSRSGNVLDARCEGNGFASSGIATVDVSSLNISDYQWINIAGVYNINGTIELYIDGVNVSNGNFTLSGNNIGLTNGNKYIGSNASNRYFVGNMDMVAFWNKPLTPQEILDYKDCPLSGSEIDLEGYWNFEEGGGLTALDLSGNSYNGTINGAIHDSTNVQFQSCSSTNPNGCDSTLNLTINNSVSSSNNQSICAGQSIMVGTNTYSANGTYIDTLTTVNGCDSTVTTILTVNPSGCTDPTACNYNPNATCDDGSCLTVYGCIDPQATNYNPNATCPDGSCIYCFSYGCTDPTACNYDPNAQCDDGTCLTTYGCTDPTSCNYNPNATCNDGSCVSAIYGCTDSTAFNYNPNACYDDGSCISAIYGCTDSTAFNHDSNANTNDGSCCFDNYITIIINNGSVSNDIWWMISSLNGGAPLSYGFNYSTPNQDSSDIQNLCLTDSCYTLSLFSYSGLGWNGGSCQIYNNNVLVGIYTLNSQNLSFTLCLSTIYGCTDPTANNYDPLATVDDGSCTYVSCGGITGVYMSDVIHDRVTFNWDNMNSSTCQVDQIRFRYREIGTNSWSMKTMGVPVGSGCNTSNTSKLVLGFTPSTTYEYDFKLWYCNASTVNWHASGTFATAPQCDNVNNVTPTPLTSTKTEFCWDSVSTYEFVRLKYRIDSAGTLFSNIGGFGVFSPILCKTKNGLNPGTNYRVMYRTWCNATGGPYRSPQWDGPVLWTQPTSIRVDESSVISHLEVYPNPSRDIFNVEFTSDTKQTIEVRVTNLVGEIIFRENLTNFKGKYNHLFNLSEYSKGIYLLEIDTDNGIVNKKLILQ